MIVTKTYDIARYIQSPLLSVSPPVPCDRHSSQRASSELYSSRSSMFTAENNIIGSLGKCSITIFLFYILTVSSFMCKSFANFVSL